MELNSAVNAAMELKQANFANKVQTTLLKKAMDVSTGMAQDLLNSMTSAPVAFPGDPGYLFDASA